MLLSSEKLFFFFKNGDFRIDIFCVIPFDVLYIFLGVRKSIIIYIFFLYMWHISIPELVWYYKKRSLPMNPHVRLFVVWLAGRSAKITGGKCIK